jgi:CheY-like chemotaxis protein
VPVMVVSVIDDRRKAFALGADSYATKPADARWLEEDLYRIMLRQRLRHVLIADDDEGHRYILRAALAPVCLSISEANSGGSALERITAEPPDLLVVDWRMPVIDGFELIQRVRRLPSCGRLPILLCTSNEPGEHERELIRALHVCFHSKNDLGNRAILRAVVSCIFATLPPTTHIPEEARAAARSAFR